MKTKERSRYILYFSPQFYDKIESNNVRKRDYDNGYPNEGNKFS